jgi:GAF domain-containing protein
VEPVAESLDALRRLSETGDYDLVAGLRATAEDVVAVVPGCVGLSICMFEPDVTFTLVATPERVRILDAAQYLDGGPCEQAATTEDEVEVDDLLGERQWRLLAAAAAANGVHSSLSLPLRSGGHVHGSVNLYADSADAFEPEGVRRLAHMFGAVAADAVMNADLSMSSAARASDAGAQMDRQENVDIATGVLSQRDGVSVEEARRRLRDSADRAGVPVDELAELIVSGDLR